MIDLHCHLLPGIDDGAKDLETALEMARIAWQDGIQLIACTPHIYPGLYPNDAQRIRVAVESLGQQLKAAQIPLTLTYGADIQVDPELVAALQQGTRPSLHGSRYFLYEPPHHIAPSYFLDSLFDCLAGGYVPIITHPERLTWLDESHYVWFQEAVEQGAWIQVTAGALTGRFGRRPRYWGERLLGEGLVHLLATDAHNLSRRPPLLAEGREAAARLVGEEEARQLVCTRPQAVLDDLPPTQIHPPTGASLPPEEPKKPWFKRWFQG